METQNNTLNMVILVLTLITIGALAVSSTSVIIESVIALYFWYVALASMSSLLILWAVMFLMLSAKTFVKWYQQKYNHENETMRSWKWLHK
ncbi:MAG: hypothetical protein P1P93_05065 [Gammaproteobacteria bacterium]|nr:hypothetical protein [Gammaproteobacteria bacterium]